MLPVSGAEQLMASGELHAPPGHLRERCVVEDRQGVPLAGKEEVPQAAGAGFLLEPLQDRWRGVVAGGLLAHPLLVFVLSRVHLLVQKGGQPVEVLLRDGARCEVHTQAR
jgi:hypothetical protein